MLSTEFSPTLTEQPVVKVNAEIDDAGTFLTMTVAEKREWVR